MKWRLPRGASYRTAPTTLAVCEKEPECQGAGRRFDRKGACISAPLAPFFGTIAGAIGTPGTRHRPEQDHDVIGRTAPQDQALASQGQGPAASRQVSGLPPTSEAETEGEGAGHPCEEGRRGGD